MSDMNESETLEMICETTRRYYKRIATSGAASVKQLTMAVESLGPSLSHRIHE